MRLCWIGLLFVWSLTTTPRTLVAQYNEIIVNRVVDQRLVKQNIETITQDKIGFLWFGSGNGLLRYDGHDIKIFRHEINNPKSLKNNRIRSIFSDSEGNLWATTQGGGLSLFVPETESFINFAPEESPNADVESNNLDFWSISEGKNHNLWLSSFSGGGFYRFNKKTKVFTKYVTPMAGVKHYSETSTVIQTNDFNLWVGTDESGIAVLDTLGNTINRFTYNPTDSHSLLSNSIKTLFEDSKGRVWVGTRGGGLLLYVKENQSFIRPNALKQSTVAVFNDIFNIIEDEASNLWIATDNGLVIYNPNQDKILKHFFHEPFNEKSLATDRVRSIYKDISGIIWVGNDGGGVHQLIKKKKFYHVSVDPKNPQKLNTNIIRSFLQVNETTLWVGTQGGGINEFDLTTGKVKQVYQLDFSNPFSISENEVTTMLKDPKGGIWLGTWGGGLNYYNLDTKRFFAYRYDQNNPFSLSDDRVQSIYIDKSGTFWVGTENGLNIFYPETGKFQRIQHNPDNTNSLSGNSIQSLAFIEDANNQYWIGTWQGLNLYDRKTNSFTRFQHENDNPKSITSDHIISLYDDGKGSLWIGTFSGGLNRLDKKTMEFEVFSESDGLPNNVVFGILPGIGNSLWLSTNNGLSLFDISTKQFKNFSYDDGLQGNEFWWGAAYKAPDGRLFFGGTNGFTMFYPSDITVSNYIPPIIISSFTVFDTPYSIFGKYQIELDYESNYLTISFAALDYTNTQKNQYAYQMEGVDKSWIYSGNRNLVSYAFLNHGEYTFKVIGSNSNGVWNRTGASIKITIHPPFWKETWFLTGILLLIMGFIAGIFRFRTNQIKKQNKKLEALVNERTYELALRQAEVLKRNNDLRKQAEQLQHQNEEIERQRDTILENSKQLESINEELLDLNKEKNYLMSIVAHDLRNPLATVKSFVDILQDSPDLEVDEKKHILQIIDNSIDRQFEMITKILDIRAADSGKIQLHLESVNASKLCQAIYQQFVQKASQKMIHLKFDEANDNPKFIRVDKHYFSQIIENLLSNAIKFSPNGTDITLKLLKDKKRIKISVSDQGPGISLEDQQKMFGKFQRLSALPTGGESSTGLGLSIVKRYVETMNGTVWCDSKLGHGATFWVEFPELELS